MTAEPTSIYSGWTKAVSLYSKAIVTASMTILNAARLERDPYLETREKEDAFLRRVTEAIEQGLRFAPVGMLPFTPPATVEAPSAEDDENISAALDFADSF